MPEARSHTATDLPRAVAEGATRANVFGEVTLEGDVLRCAARDSAAPAWYAVHADAGKLWVALLTEDRWLSQSIEQDLVHTGDRLHDLMSEELAEQGHGGKAERFEHFRDEQKRFVFRTPIPLEAGAWTGSGSAPPEAAATAIRFLLACEAMFRALGDMSGGDE